MRITFLDSRDFHSVFLSNSMEEMETRPKASETIQELENKVAKLQKLIWKMENSQELDTTELFTVHYVQLKLLLEKLPALNEKVSISSILLLTHLVPKVSPSLILQTLNQCSFQIMYFHKK